MPSDALALTACVRDGQLKIRNRRELDAQVARWKEGTELLITIERKRATRSRDQNAWYWSGILGALAEHTGYTADELHDYCKQRFNAKRLILTNEHGEIVDESRVGGTTTTLNRITFGEYCERIREWAAADLGVVIADPDPAWRETRATTEAA